MTAMPLSARPHSRLSESTRRLAMGTALAAAMLIGSASETGARDRADLARAASRVSSLLAQGHTDQAIAMAEAALAGHPQDMQLRGALGQAYLRAGRFASAATVLGDAVSLGDRSGRTALGLALAQIAIGQTRDAIATLERAHEFIPAGDLGLALALAGDTSRGVTVLTDAVRGGGGSPKLRQNLAYAYALDGRWSEARLTASLDVPGDQLDARLQQWAMTMRGGADQQRIATLLGVPVREDAGLPVSLALNPPAPETLAARDPVPVQAPAVDAKGELPALADPMPMPMTMPVQVPVQGAATAAVADATPVSGKVHASPATSAAPASAVRHRQALTFVSIPVVQALPQGRDTRSAIAHAARNKAAAPATSLALDGGETHFVQLGAFSSARNAQRAMGYFLTRQPQLSGHQFVVTRARVHGRLFWRVAAAGFDAAGATGMCSNLRHAGSACFAYAGRHGQARGVAEPSHGTALAVRR